MKWDGIQRGGKGGCRGGRGSEGGDFEWENPFIHSLIGLHILYLLCGSSQKTKTKFWLRNVLILEYVLTLHK